MRRFAITGVMLLGATLGSAGTDEDMSARLAHFIVEHVRGSVVACSEELQELHPDRFMVCAAYSARWSSFKSDWEFILDRADLPVRPKPTTAWTKRQGRYERNYRLDEERRHRRLRRGGGAARLRLHAGRSRRHSGRSA